MAIASAIAEKPSAPSPIQGSGIASFFFIGLPILLVALCLAAKFRSTLEIAAGPRAGLIFVLLDSAHADRHADLDRARPHRTRFSLFTLTKCPFDAVALKLFTGIERFEIMAIPFFILAGNLPHARRGGQADDRFCDVGLMGHWHGRLGARGHRGLRDVVLGVRFECGDAGGDRLHRARRRWPARVIRCASARASSRWRDRSAF